MRTQAETRHQKILALLGEGPLAIAQLADALGVSSVTARRDVESLAHTGLVTRTRGVVTRAADGNRPPTIGLLVPDIGRGHAESIAGVRRAAAEAGARLVLAVSGGRPEQEAAQLEALQRSDVSGLLLAPAWVDARPHPEAEQRVLALTMPVVLLERDVRRGTALAALDCVRIDHEHGAAMAVRHLASRGRQRIALLAGTHSALAGPLTAGHGAATAALGLPGPTVGTLDELVTAARSGRVDAAVVHGDEDALRLVQAARTGGLRIPEDLALVAYGDHVAALADVPLTAVASPDHALGEAAARLLLDRVAARAARAARTSPGGPGDTARDQGEPRHHLDLLPRLCVRVSCGGDLENAVAPAGSSGGRVITIE